MKGGGMEGGGRATTATPTSFICAPAGSVAPGSLLRTPPGKSLCAPSAIASSDCSIGGGLSAAAAIRHHLHLLVGSPPACRRACRPAFPPTPLHPASPPAALPPPAPSLLARPPARPPGPVGREPGMQPALPPAPQAPPLRRAAAAACAAAPGAASAGSRCPPSRCRAGRAPACSSRRCPRPHPRRCAPGHTTHRHAELRLGQQSPCAGACIARKRCGPAGRWKSAARDLCRCRWRHAVPLGRGAAGGGSL